MKSKLKYICLLLWFVSPLGVFHINYIQRKEKKQFDKIEQNQAHNDTLYKRADCDKKKLINIIIIIINKTIDTYERSKGII